MPTKTKSKKTAKVKKSVIKKTSLLSRFTLLGIKFLFISHADIPTITGTAIGIAASSSNTGYWIAASDGGVFAEGTAPYYGSMGGKSISAPIVDIAATTDRLGYYLIGLDGAVYAFGDARYGGAMNCYPFVNGACQGKIPIAGNIIGLAAHGGGGYWIMTDTGATYAIGGAPSMGYNPTGFGGTIVSITPTTNGQGYYAVSSHGQVYALPVGSGGCGNPNATNIIAASADGAGTGCWIAGSDGGVFSYGASAFYGSATSLNPAGGIKDIASTVDGKGYWLLGGDGGIFAYGDAVYQGRVQLTAPTINSFTIANNLKGIVSGQSISLSYSVNNATQVSITGYSSSVLNVRAGSVTIIPTTTKAGPQTFTLSAVNSGGSSAAVVTIGVCPVGTTFNGTFGCLTPATPTTSPTTSPTHTSTATTCPINSNWNGSVGACLCNTGYDTTTVGCQLPSATLAAATYGHGCLSGFGWVKSSNGGICQQVIQTNAAGTFDNAALYKAINGQRGFNLIWIGPFAQYNCIAKLGCN
jgi:hypothetical protein